MKKTFLVLALALEPGAPWAAETPAADAARVGDYLFSLNGQAHVPTLVHLHGEPGKPAPGDVLRNGWMYVPLGEEKEYRLEEIDKEPRAVRWIQDGKARWLAASTHWNYEPDGKTVLDGLAALSADELKQLRAVALHSWDEKVAREVARLDGDRVSILFHEDAIVGRSGTLPAFPPGLKYLFIGDSSPPVIADFQEVGKLSRLELLDVDRGRLDLRQIQNLTRLRFLRLGESVEVQNLESLGRFKALRYLDLDYCDDLKSLDPILPCTDLRVLRIRHTKVQDLSLLAKFPRLREVDADSSPVYRLPGDKLPSLARIGLVKTYLATGDLAAFRSLNPGCTVHPQPADVLQAALGGCDAMRLVWYESKDGDSQERSVEVSDPKAIEAFVSSISIGEVREWSCACTIDTEDNTQIDFFLSGKRVNGLLVHHGSGLVCDTIGGEGVLEKKSAEAIVGWLRDHRVSKGKAKARD